MIIVNLNLCKEDQNYAQVCLIIKFHQVYIQQGRLSFHLSQPKN